MYVPHYMERASCRQEPEEVKLSSSKNRLTDGVYAC
jgi:hypothetical protein